MKRKMIKDVSAPVKGNDEVKLVEDKLENNEISDVNDGDQKEGSGANKDVDPAHEADCRRMPEKDESMETEHADKIHATCGWDCENASVIKAFMDAIGEFVIVDNYAVPSLPSIPGRR